MSYTYKLSLEADLSSKSGIFDPRSTNGTDDRSRFWSRLLDGATKWEELPQINPDTPGDRPKLNYSDKTADSLVVAIYFVEVAETTLQSITVSAIFTPYEHDGSPIASPYSDADGNIQTIISATYPPVLNASTPSLEPIDGGSGFLFTPGPFHIDSGSVLPNSNLLFECTLLVQCTLSNGDRRNYAYDPEMEIDVTTPTLAYPPKAAVGV